MSDYYTLITTIGQDKLAAAATGGPALSLTQVKIGDGGGASYDPVEGQLDLVGPHYTAGIASIGYQAGGIIVIEAVIPANQGGWYVREAGVYDAAGALIAIAKLPPRYKPLPASGASDDMTIRLVLDIGNSGNVTVVVDPMVQIHLGRLTRCPWIAVEDDTIAAPPAGPELGATYLIPVGSGAWAGHNGKLAHWTGAAWAIIDPPADTVVQVQARPVTDPAKVRRKHAANDWRTFMQAPIQDGSWVYAPATGTANALVAALAPALPAYRAGQLVHVKVAAPNTAAPTLANNALDPKTIVWGDGSVPLPGDLAAGQVGAFLFDGVRHQIMHGLQPSSLKNYCKVRLRGNLTLYVRADGNDANDGLANTPAGAFREIRAALANALTYFDTLGYTIVIVVGPGAYLPFTMDQAPASRIVILGDVAVPANCIIAGGGTHCCAVSGGSYLTILGFRLEGTNGGLVATLGSTINFNAIEFANSGAQMWAVWGSQILGAGGYRIAAGGVDHLLSDVNSSIEIKNNTVTIPAPVAFSHAFAAAANGQLNAQGAFFTGGGVGGCAGPRYNSNVAGVINSGGGGANFFPGNVAGQTVNGGIYI